MPASLAMLAISSPSAAELIGIAAALSAVAGVIALLRYLQARRPTGTRAAPPPPVHQPADEEPQLVTPRAEPPRRRARRRRTRPPRDAGPGVPRDERLLMRSGTPRSERLDPGVLRGDPAADAVQVSVFAPAEAAPGSTIFVQAFAHQLMRTAEAMALALQFDPDSSPRGRRTLQMPIVRGSQLTFALRIGALAADEPTAMLVWQGATEGVGFGVEIPANLADGTTLIGRLAVRCDGIPAGDVTFKLQVASAASQALVRAGEARRYEHVFLSYAREDQARVLEAVQVVRALGMSFFQDVLSIDPGERWERRLYEELDTCDALLLFWSVAAKRSEWVRKEVGYALSRNGGEDDVAPAIRPVFIEGPPVEAPWEELAELQWDDPLLYFAR